MNSRVGNLCYYCLEYYEYHLYCCYASKQQQATDKVCLVASPASHKRVHVKANTTIGTKYVRTGTSFLDKAVRSSELLVRTYEYTYLVRVRTVHKIKNCFYVNNLIYYQVCT